MLPSREKALRGLDYEAPDAEKYKIEQDEKQKLENEKVKVEMWQMSAGRYTQAKITYRGESSIVCLNDELPVIDPEIITKVITDFYNYIDLAKTAILKRASANDRISMSTKIEKKTFASKIDGISSKSKTVKGSGVYVRHNIDSELTQVGMEYNNMIYKERLMQIFAYAEKLEKDESVPLEERGRFTTDEIIDNVFAEVYTKITRLTIKNKTMSMLRFMVSNGWIKKVAEGTFRASIYKVIANPYKDEMPAQAEPIDYEYLQKAKMQQLAMYRQS